MATCGPGSSVVTSSRAPGCGFVSVDHFCAVDLATGLGGVASADAAGAAAGFASFAAGLAPLLATSLPPPAISASSFDNV